MDHCKKEISCCQINKCLKKYPCLPDCPTSEKTKVMVCADGKIFWVPRSCIVDPDCEHTINCLCEIEQTDCPENSLGQLSLIKDDQGVLHWINSRCLTECRLNQLQCCLDELPELGLLTVKVFWNLTEFFADNLLKGKPWQITEVLIGDQDLTNPVYQTPFSTIPELEQILESQGWFRDTTQETDIVYFINVQASGLIGDSKITLIDENMSVFCVVLDQLFNNNNCQDLSLIYRTGDKNYTLGSLDKILECANLQTEQTICDDRLHVALTPFSQNPDNISFSVGPKGEGFLSAQKPTPGDVEGGNCRGLNSVDFQMVRTDPDQVAGGNSSVIVGGEKNEITSNGFLGFIGSGFENKVTGGTAVVVGGGRNQSTSFNTFVGAGVDNSVGGFNSVIVGGGRNTSGANLGFIGGGQDNDNQGEYSVIVGGQANVIDINGINSFIGGGYRNRTEAPYSGISSGFEANARLYGQQAHASGGFDNLLGSAQSSQYVLRGVVFGDSKFHSLYLDGDGVSQRLEIRQNSTWTFCISITARSRTNVNFASYKIDGCIDNDNGTISIVTLPTNIAANLTDVKVISDGNILDILVKNVPNQTMQWVAVVETVETFFDRP